MSLDIELSQLGRTRASRFLTEEYVEPIGPANIDDIFAHQRHKEEYELETIHPQWKRELHALLEMPTSSTGAFLVHILITSLILTSAFVTVMETVPAFHSISTSVWFGVETSLVALFTVEYIARCIAWSGTTMSLFKWMISFYGILDLLSVLPYYIEIILQQDTSVFFRFSILRMFRLVRVFRPFRYNHTILLTIEVMYLSVRRSQHALLAISFFVAMVLTIFSTLLYFAERGTWDTEAEMFINSDGNPSQFSSIPAAAWFVLVTITTVGYGEIVPRSFLGRVLTLPLLVFGLLLIALPSFVLGREFSLVWEKMTKDEEQREQEPDSAMPNGHDSARLPSTPLPRDLSNLKLAQNQTELSTQISDLRATVDAQGQMIRRLLEVLEGNSAPGNSSASSLNLKGKTRDG